MSGAILEVQDEIAKQISAALRLRLTGDDERRLTKRYTENAAAYEAYLKGRYCWSKYARAGLEHAVDYFRQAINLDPTYALAYAGAVDCYLRLATNYIRPAEELLEESAPTPAPKLEEGPPQASASQGMLNIRDEWDRKAAERESKRAAELKSHYPAAHQWNAAYLFSKRLYDEASAEMVARESNTNANDGPGSEIDAALLDQIQSSPPTHDEEVQIFCTVAREQVAVGNYEAGCAVLRKWWTIGEWPRLGTLSPGSSADLLLTAGSLAGFVVSTRQVPRGQKQAEELLNGAIALFEQLGAKTRAAEGRMEVANCYYREGLFDVARTTLRAAIEELPNDDCELRSVALVRLGTVERHAGRLHDSLARMNEAAVNVELAGPWATGRYHQELATTLKELAIAERRNEYFDLALDHSLKALHEFQGIGNHRYVAAVENNVGLLLLLAGERLDEAEARLIRARNLFDGFTDKVKRAQVDETLAWLHIAAKRFEVAEQAIVRAIETLETGDEEALLAESLTTHGIVLCGLGRHREAKRVLDHANRVAESCGDSERAGCALVIMIEEMSELLEDDERLELGARMSQLLSHSQQASIVERLQKCLKTITRAHAGHSGQREPRTLAGS